jgi:tetratricopeptide (TPR) repeat protein
MALLNLDAELNAEAEAPKRQVDAERTGAAAALQAALGDRAAKSAPPKVVGMIRRAVKMMDKGPDAARKAGQLCLKAIEAAPDFGLAYQAMALSLERLGRLSAALSCYQEAYKHDPGNPDLYLNLGMVAWKLDMLEAAEKFLRLHMQLTRTPKAASPISRAFCATSKNMTIPSSCCARRSTPIRKTPICGIRWARRLLESGEPEQALTFYQEAKRLKPDYARAYHNMAFAYDLLGDARMARSRISGRRCTLNPDSGRQGHHGARPVHGADGPWRAGRRLGAV